MAEPRISIRDTPLDSSGRGLPPKRKRADGSTSAAGGANGRAVGDAAGPAVVEFVTGVFGTQPVEVGGVGVAKCGGTIVGGVTVGGAMVRGAMVGGGAGEVGAADDADPIDGGDEIGPGDLSGGGDKIGGAPSLVEPINGTVAVGAGTGLGGARVGHCAVGAGRGSASDD
jgi:hypothetical protein